MTPNTRRRRARSSPSFRSWVCFSRRSRRGERTSSRPNGEPRCSRNSMRESARFEPSSSQPSPGGRVDASAPSNCSCSTSNTGPARSTTTRTHRLSSAKSRCFAIRQMYGETSDYAIDRRRNPHQRRRIASTSCLLGRRARLRRRRRARVDRRCERRQLVANSQSRARLIR